MTDLSSHALDILSDAIDGSDKLDVRALENEISDRVHDAADSACIYYSHCLDIISRYERDSGLTESDMGGTYRADQWQEAAQAWAYEIAAAVLHQEAHEALERVKEAADELCDLAAEIDPDQSPRPEDLTVSRGCPHGWAPHDRETETGAHVWTPGHLEGCNAVGIDAGPFWLSYTWTPAPASVES